MTSWQYGLASDSCVTMRLLSYHNARVLPRMAAHGGADVQQHMHCDADAARRRLRSCRRSRVLCQCTATAQWQCATGRNRRPHLRNNNRSIAAVHASIRAAVPVPKSTDEAIILLERLQRVHLLRPLQCRQQPICSNIASDHVVSYVLPCACVSNRLGTSNTCS